LLALDEPSSASPRPAEPPHSGLPQIFARPQGVGQLEFGAGDGRFEIVKYCVHGREQITREELIHYEVCLGSGLIKSEPEDDGCRYAYA
jgi:hypothetical protein